MNQRQLIERSRGRPEPRVLWRNLPPQYGQWRTVYRLFRRWQRAGNWGFSLKDAAACADAAGATGWLVGVDSAIMSAHQHAAGARRNPALSSNRPVG